MDFNKVDLKKILLNILYNAIKYTAEGEIKISTINNEILIQNNGEMIKEEYFQKIFEPFFTVDQSKNRQNNSFGLGLSIVKNLCKNNSYTSCVKSSNDEKTIFSIAPIK